MQSKTILNIESPKTQTVEAVKSLLAYVGQASSPLPNYVSLENGRLVLVLANKKDVYYTCTARACSCPSAAYRPGQSCKHMRKFFPAEATSKPMDSGSIRPKCGAFRPFSELPSEERRAAEVA